MKVIDMCNKLGSRGLCKYYSYHNYLELTKEEMQERAKSYRCQRNERNQIKGEVSWSYHRLNYMMKKAIHRNRKPSVIKAVERLSKQRNFYYK